MDSGFVTRTARYSRRKHRHRKKPLSLRERFIKVTENFITSKRKRDVNYMVYTFFGLLEGIGLSSEAIRIPVSLKVEQDDKEFSRFVEDLRDSKRLSPFLVDLLSAYFHDMSVKTHVERYIASNSPFAKVMARIEAIREEHARSVMTLEMASQQVGIAMRSAEQTTEKLQQLTEPSFTEFKEGVDSRFKQLEGSVGSLSEKLDTLLTLLSAKGLTAGGISQPSLQPEPHVVHTPAPAPQPAPVPVVQTPVVQAPVEPQPASQPVVQPAPSSQPAPTLQPVPVSEEVSSFPQAPFGGSSAEAPSGLPALQFEDDNGFSDEDSAAPATFRRFLGGRKRYSLSQVADSDSDEGSSAPTEQQ